ncbi:ABC transporter ATP-binding protein [Sulfobacillus thermosulfidooxidans]|uniref:ABC transporter ATP-binding protein n=1 Tax=Sulfobacillus thermosulfidooxidans TaxID=28034 RepID=UPI0002F41879|nr:ABC transporter ATP-binding protein [Sulfobacillus thermosulfidooxidans]
MESLRFQRVRKEYPKQIVAIRALDFVVNSGEIKVLLGPNGAGKSTFVKLATGIMQPTCGIISVNGSPLSRQSKRHIGLVLGGTQGLHWQMTVQETLLFWGALYGITKDLKRKVSEMIDHFGMREYANTVNESLSLGQHMRVKIARALIHNPHLVIFDEPTVGLDPEGRHLLYEVIQRMAHRENKAIILCTHDLDEAIQVADWVYILNHGEWAFQGEPHELMDLVESYVVLTLPSESNIIDTMTTFAESVSKGDGAVRFLVNRENMPQVMSFLRNRVPPNFHVDRTTVYDAYLSALRRHGNAANE